MYINIDVCGTHVQLKKAQCTVPKNLFSIIQTALCKAYVHVCIYTLYINVMHHKMDQMQAELLSATMCLHKSHPHNTTLISTPPVQAPFTLLTQWAELQTRNHHVTINYFLVLFLNSIAILILISLSRPAKLARS